VAPAANTLAPAHSRPAADPHGHHARMLAPLLMGPVIYVLLQSLLIPSLGAVAERLHTSHLDASWVLTAFLVSGAVSTPIAGRFGDMFGKRRVLLWVLWISAAGGLVSALSTSLAPMLVGRVLAGTSTATMPLAYGIIRETMPRERVASDIGLVSASIAIGTALGAVSAGLIVSHLGTAWLFWVPFLLLLPTCVAAQLWVPESPVRTGGSVDWRGATVMSVALLCILVAISESSIWGWGSARTLGLLALGLATLVGWVFLELATERPLIDMRLMARPAVWWTNLTALLFGFGMFGVFVLVPQFVEVPRSTGYGFGSSITEAGLFLLPATLTMGLGGPLAGRLEGRLGSKPLLIAGACFSAAGYGLLAVEHSSRPSIYVGFLLLGIGLGVGYAVLPHLIVLAVPGEHTGAATAINVIARNLGGALGIQICAAVIASNLAAGAAFPASAGFTDAFWVCAVGGIGGAVCSLCIPIGRHTSVPVVVA
jgi:MFS family permease